MKECSFPLDIQNKELGTKKKAKDMFVHSLLILTLNLVTAWVSTMYLEGNAVSENFIYLLSSTYVRRSKGIILTFSLHVSLRLVDF